MAESLSGVIERITFHNIDNGYCVLRVRARGHREVVTVVGNLQHPVAGEYVEASGKWVTDRQHGLQLKADTVKTTPPHTAEGIAKYLGSGLVRGVGPGYARRIVDVFGDKTLDVIDQSPTFLTQVKGIGPKLIEKIRESWREQQAVRSIMVFLHSYGIGTARAVRIYRQYGENAIELVRSNPYRLSTDIWGVGFQTADELALKLGLPRDSPFRAQAAVRHVLQEAQSDGHVGFPEELAMQAAEALTQIPPDGIRDAVEQLRITDEIIRDSVALVTKDAGVDPEAATGLPADAQLLYLKPLFLAELGTARQLAALAAGAHPLRTADHAAALGWAEQKMGLTFAASQRAAITEAVAHKLMVLTGGPGTGKTTIVRAILEIVSAKSLRVLLAAPTGRAAKRLAESTGREAKTIHRLLEFDPGIGTFRRGKENPLDVDVLVVDEVSMVDVVLMNQLLRAVPPFAAVVFVGDVDQLPSVGAGAVLADLIASGVVPVARLTEVHRQAGASWIVRAAHAVNHGEQPESAPAGGDGDFYFVEADKPEAVIDKIRQMVTTRIPARFGLDPLRDVQVLTPQVKTELGVANLNRVLQEALNPPRPGLAEAKKFDTAFRVGDKVMQVRNNYQREVFNGDIGRVTGIDAVEQVVAVDFDGRPVEYDLSDLDELQLAYAISVHKSQGAEYPAVVVPVSYQHFVMLQRNLLYTAITRGRKLVVLVGSRKALWRAVTTADTKRRFGLLRWRLSSQMTHLGGMTKDQ
ncbi:MAG TPA: ATP-dependent RecD-like DNA helicase [Urbifossiella sp.]|nr:ATP-dependent RecD-like DNA helicase [Urbifossiella sp.]